MKLREEAKNILGWRTNRKIIVFESDDWGSIRTSSKAAYDQMLRQGVRVDDNYFTKYDCLESNYDLERLFNLLLEFKDFRGRPPVFTPMCIVANPDFDKIRESDFQQYYFESLSETINKYPNHDKLIDLWRKGVSEHIFVPALHGREHLNVRRFMLGLNDINNQGLKISLQNDSIGATRFLENDIIEYLGAFHPANNQEISELGEIIEDALMMFNKICGYSATHFIGPNKEPARELDKILSDGGVKFLTQSKLRKYPKGNGKYGFELNWLGKLNKYNQTFIVRNSGFEPSGKVSNVDKCLSEIESSFRWKKPAVISTHRVNYIGSISQKNGDEGLLQLKLLLEKIIKTWPEVEFMTSTELGKEILE
jgi:hypothetical protein